MRRFAKSRRVAKRLRPSREQGVSPTFRAALVQAGDPPPLALATPTARRGGRGASGCTPFSSCMTLELLDSTPTEVFGGVLSPVMSRDASPLERCNAEIATAPRLCRVARVGHTPSDEFSGGHRDSSPCAAAALYRAAMRERIAAGLSACFSKRCPTMPRTVSPNSYSLRPDDVATAGQPVPVMVTYSKTPFSCSYFRGLCAVLLFGTCVQAQDRRPLARYWKLSVATLGAAQTADAATSWQRWELNPILADSHQCFGLRSSVIKSSLFASAVFTQHSLPRHRKVATIMNFAASAAYGYISWRNSHVPTPGAIR